MPYLSMCYRMCFCCDTTQVSCLVCVVIQLSCVVDYHSVVCWHHHDAMGLCLWRFNTYFGLWTTKLIMIRTTLYSRGLPSQPNCWVLRVVLLLIGATVVDMRLCDVHGFMQMQAWSCSIVWRAVDCLFLISIAATAEVFQVCYLKVLRVFAGHLLPCSTHGRTCNREYPLPMLFQQLWQMRVRTFCGFPYKGIVGFHYRMKENKSRPFSLPLFIFV